MVENLDFEESYNLPTISKKDVQFISFCMDEHANLVERNFGCTWEASIAEERERIKRVMRKVIHLQKCGQVTINEQDYMFIEFAMTEQADFAAEGLARAWTKRPKTDFLKTTRLLDKLRKILCIPSDNDTLS